jgi:acyl carrier protein
VPVHDALEQVFRDVFGDDTIALTEETTARDIPQWDSLGHVNLMFAIEERFGVRFRGNELAELANVGELERFLEERAAGSEPA